LSRSTSIRKVARRLKSLAVDIGDKTSSAANYGEIYSPELDADVDGSWPPSIRPKVKFVVAQSAVLVAEASLAAEKPTPLCLNRDTSLLPNSGRNCNWIRETKLLYVPQLSIPR